MPATDVEVCNLCLDKLGAEPITSISTPVSDRERRLSRLYPRFADIELGKRRWRFAIEPRTLTLASTAAGQDRPYRFTIPADVLRVLRRKYETWEKTGAFLADWGDKLDVLAIIKVPEGKWESTFVNVLASRLALECSDWVTGGNRGKKADLKLAYDEAVAEAARQDSFETNPQDELVADDDTAFDWLAGRVAWNG